MQGVVKALLSSSGSEIYGRKSTESLHLFVMPLYRRILT